MRILFVGAAVFAAAFFVLPVQAQQVCGSRDAIVKRLADVHGENRRAAGIAANGNLIEIFAAKSGTWTVMVTQPGGITCVVAVGDHWQLDTESVLPERKDGA